MLKKSNKVIFCLFTFSILFNIAIRYPEYIHSNGRDSFSNLGASEAIINQGFDSRHVNILSFFGLYPSSYNLGGSFFLSSISSILGISVESAILFSSIFIGVFSIFTMFVASRFFTDDFYTAFVSAFIFSTTNGFIGLTSYTFSFRTLFLLLLPVFLTFLLQNIKQISVRHLSFSIILLIILTSIHRMAFFAYFIFGFTILGLFFNLFKRNQFIMGNSKKAIILVTLFLVTLSLLPFFDLSFYHLRPTARGFFGNSDSIVSLILNTFFRYSMFFGILLVFTPIGYLKQLSSSKYISRVTILFTSIFFLFWHDVVYALAFFQVLLSLFAAVGLIEVMGKLSLFFRSKGLVLMVLITILVSSILLPNLVSVRDGGEDYPGYEDATIINYETYNCAIYLRYQSSIPSFSNVEAIDEKVTAYSLNNKFKLLSTSNYSTEFIPVDELLDGKTDYILQPVLYSKPILYSVFMYGESSDSSRMQNTLDYNLFGNGKYYVIIYSALPNSIYNNKEVIDSIFLISLNQNTYKTYDDGFQYLRYLNYNNE